jgi:ribulose-5-phosphate 4-epimerase/fuculose-1-phosphate aldolase
MTRDETKLREAIAALGASLFMRGLTHGSTGNISVRCRDGYLATPTGASLGSLDPARLSFLDAHGSLTSGDAPTKERLLHLAMYEARAGATAVVHLHSTHSVAISVLDGLDPDDLLPPLTAYYAMRIGRLPLVPYFPPGDAKLASAVRSVAHKHHAMLLANHGPVVAGTSLSAAADAIEELEATARLYLLVRGSAIRPLSDAQVAALIGGGGARWLREQAGPASDAIKADPSRGRTVK